jgi:hypothetical protein
VPQPFDRHLAGDGDGGRVQHLGDAGPDQRDTEQMAAIRIDHHPGPTGVPVRVKLGSHHDVADFDVDRPHPVPGLLGLLHRQSDGGCFGIGGEGPRLGVMVGGRRMDAPRRGVQRGSHRAGPDGRTTDASLVFALMGQQGPVIDVARCIETPIIDGPDAAGVVDVEPAARCQSYRLQADVIGERCPPCGEKHFADFQLGSVVQFQDHLLAVGPAQCADRYSYAHIRARVGESAADEFAHKGLHPGQ